MYKVALFIALLVGLVNSVKITTNKNPANTTVTNNTYITYYPSTLPATKYVKRVINKVCTLKPMMGPCRAEITMYAFNPKKMKCEKFLWGGCQGNGNRFDTQEECLNTCMNKPNTTLSIRPKYCWLTFDYGFCFGAVNRWYYDRIGKICKETIYSGCGGNRNNFYTQADCSRTCDYEFRYRATNSLPTNSTSTTKCSGTR